MSLTIVAGPTTVMTTGGRRGPADRPRHPQPRMPGVAGRGQQARNVGPSPLRAGDPLRVEGYRLVSRLGVGGTAVVYYAMAPSGGPVVVKVYCAADGAARACHREYRLASAVDPGCTAGAMGYGLSAAGPYLVTTYLPGYRCATSLLGRPMPGWLLWAIGTALARVLVAVHSRGIVHCDVKPSNLLIRGRDVRLIDFGIARYRGERCGENGIVNYSRGWAAPEQLSAAPATPAVDVFA
jgi:serine/threonine protein kinase